MFYSSIYIRGEYNFDSSSTLLNFFLIFFLKFDNKEYIIFIMMAPANNCWTWSSVQGYKVSW